MVKDGQKTANNLLDNLFTTVGTDLLSRKGTREYSLYTLITNLSLRPYRRPNLKKYFVEISLPLINSDDRYAVLL